MERQPPLRTVLQKEADAIDCDLYRLITRVERLAETIKVAGPQLRSVSSALWAARPGLRQFMHRDDREATA